MALTPEQEWTLVGCGLVAHADAVLEVGEWDRILEVVGAKLDEGETAEWIELLMDREALEKRFAGLTPLLPTFREELLHQCWRMALADGAGSEVEAEVHDRIAEAIGFERERAEGLREEWTRAAAARSEIVVGFAAVIASVDGRMDSAEAAQFDSLLERTPVPLSRRLELAEWLYNPPRIETVAERMAALPEGERDAVLVELAPLVRASARGEHERKVYFDLAERAAVPRRRAEQLLGG